MSSSSNDTTPANWLDTLKPGDNIRHLETKEPFVFVGNRNGLHAYVSDSDIRYQTTEGFSKTLYYAENNPRKDEKCEEPSLKKQKAGFPVKQCRQVNVGGYYWNTKENFLCQVISVHCDRLFENVEYQYIRGSPTKDSLSDFLNSFKEVDLVFSTSS